MRRKSFKLTCVRPQHSARFRPGRTRTGTGTPSPPSPPTPATTLWSAGKSRTSCWTKMGQSWLWFQTMLQTDIAFVYINFHLSQIITCTSHLKHKMHLICYHYRPYVLNISSLTFKYYNLRLILVRYHIQSFHGHQITSGNSIISLSSAPYCIRKIISYFKGKYTFLLEGRGNPIFRWKEAKHRKSFQYL